MLLWPFFPFPPDPMLFVPIHINAWQGGVQRCPRRYSFGEMHRPGIQAPPLGLDLLLPLIWREELTAQKPLFIHSFFIRYTFIECQLGLRHGAAFLADKDPDKGFRLPWYKDTVKGTFCSLEQGLLTGLGLVHMGWREAACGLGVEGSCRWSCKVPQPQSTLLLQVAGVALGSPRESQGSSCAFLGSYASFRRAVAILRKSTTMGHLK